MLSQLGKHREGLQLFVIADLCLAVTFNGGTYAPVAFFLVFVAIAVGAIALGAAECHVGPRIWGIAAACCALTEIFAARDWPAPALALVGVATAAAAAAMVTNRRARVIALVAVISAAVLLMASIRWTWGHADMDVFGAISNASTALLRGHNPYASTSRVFIPLSATTATWRVVHFQYGPAVPILVAPGQLLGDVRAASMAAFAVLSGFAVHLAVQANDGPRRRWRILVLCVAIPLMVGMIDNAWVDVYMVAGFAGWLALRHSHRRWAVVCLAIGLAVKPTIVVAILVPMAWSHRARVEAFGATAVAVALMVPFAVATGLREFVAGALSLFTNNGPRMDGLTLRSFGYWTFGYTVPGWLGTAVALLIVAIVIRRRPRTYSDVLGASALIMTTSLLLAQWAFYNYYFVPIWLLVLAVAGSDRRFGEADDIHLPCSAWLRRASQRMSRWQVQPRGAVASPTTGGEM